MFSDVGIWHLATTGSGVSRIFFASLEDVRCFPSLSSSSCLLEVVANIGWKTFWNCPGHISPLPFFPHVHFDIRVARAPIWITCSFEKQNRFVFFGVAQGDERDRIRYPCRSARETPCLRRSLSIDTQKANMAASIVAI